MIQKSDVLLLLTELQEKGVDVSSDINNLYRSSTISFDTLKKINDSRPLDLVNFYDKIRKSYNHKSSKLYGNIVKSDENVSVDAKTVVTTLSALLNQVLQFEAEDKPMFLKHARADEILGVLFKYVKNFDIEPAYKLLTLIKADLISSEYINGRREG